MGLGIELGIEIVAYAPGAAS